MKFLPLDYATRNLTRAPSRLAMSIGGSFLVVLLVLAAAAFIRGMNQSLAVASSKHNVILVGAGSEESIERSEVAPRVPGIVASSVSGIRERLGDAYVSPESHVALQVYSPTQKTEGGLTVIRGVLPIAFMVHPQVSIIEGNAPRSGHDEIMVGSLVAAKLGIDELKVGSSLVIDEKSWKISGIMSAPQSVMAAEIWMPLYDLQVVSQREDLSCVVISMDPEKGGEISDVLIFAAQRLDLELSAISEADYYGALTQFFAPIRWMVIVTAALIALGAIFGGLNTLYAAFASRTRELASLQVIGYSRFAILMSILQESLLTTAAASLLACVLSMLFLDGIAIRFSMGAFGLSVDANVISAGIIAGLLLGVIGAIPPGIRCLRLPINVALKS